ncbi:MAG: LLM class flavin-dependent oxidoreductase [Alphaproteobacteria bacterium]|nr:LLM class flavin-dependent oxidoreductase [Alphaproteobacteria bacterium]
MVNVGLFLANQFPAGENVAARMPLLIEQVRTARDAGYAALWMGQHYLTAPMQMVQTMPLLTRLIPESGAMRFGPCVHLLPLHNAMQLAEETATIDVMSGGRLVLGAGIGYREEEFVGSGVSLKDRVPRFTEAITVLRGLWSGSAVTFHGKHNRLEGYTTSLTPVRKSIPIWIGGIKEPAIRRAARIGDAWIAANTQTVAEMTPLMRLYDAERATAGLPAATERPILRECYVARSHNAAWAECGEAIRWKFDSYFKWGMTGEEKGAPASFEDFARERFIIGDAAFVKEELARYRAAAGFDHFIMRQQWPGVDQDKVLYAIKALGRIANELG